MRSGRGTSTCEPRRRRGWAAALLLALVVAPGVAASADAPCEGAQRIRLHTPVTFEAHELAALRALPPLRVTSVSAPPLASYRPASHDYGGVAVDLLCFITQQLGMRFMFEPALELSVAEKIQRVQDGRLDLFLPLSYLPERDRLGLFTAPFYDSHYAVIGRKGRRLALERTADLANYRVGTVGGVALLPILQGIVPPAQLRIFEQTVERGGLFDALREGDIDLAVFNQNFFSEERYLHELFDLEVVYVLREFPREYRFYLSRQPQHEPVVAAFNRYLAAVDLTDSVEAQEAGERQLVERYVAQRSRSQLVQAAAVAVALLALVFYVALRRYRSLTRQLQASREHILTQQQELQVANRELALLSQTDELTRLANRRHFDEALEREHARCRRAGRPLSLLLIDLDHFKAVNDEYGHATGDQYLRAVAGVLRACVVRPGDLAARYGGEEFVCLLPETTLQDARLVAERIRSGVAALALPNALSPSPVLTVSAGVATLAPGGSLDAQALLAHADTQLYAAKHAGRNRVCAALLGEGDEIPPKPITDNGL